MFERAVRFCAHISGRTLNRRSYAVEARRQRALIQSLEPRRMAAGVIRGPFNWQEYMAGAGSWVLGLGTNTNPAVWGAAYGVASAGNAYASVGGPGLIAYGLALGDGDNVRLHSTARSSEDAEGSGSADSSFDLSGSGYQGTFYSTVDVTEGTIEAGSFGQDWATSWPAEDLEDVHADVWVTGPGDGSSYNSFNLNDGDIHVENATSINGHGGGGTILPAYEPVGTGYDYSSFTARTSIHGDAAGMSGVANLNADLSDDGESSFAATSSYSGASTFSSEVIASGGFSTAGQDMIAVTTKTENTIGRLMADSSITAGVSGMASGLDVALVTIDGTNTDTTRVLGQASVDNAASYSPPSINAAAVSGMVDLRVNGTNPSTDPSQQHADATLLAYAAGSGTDAASLNADYAAARGGKVNEVSGSARTEYDGHASNMSASMNASTNVEANTSSDGSFELVMGTGGTIDLASTQHLNSGLALTGGQTASSWTTATLNNATSSHPVSNASTSSSLNMDTGSIGAASAGEYASVVHAVGTSESSSAANVSDGATASSAANAASGVGGYANTTATGNVNNSTTLNSTIGQSSAVAQSDDVNRTYSGYAHADARADTGFGISTSAASGSIRATQYFTTSGAGEAIVAPGNFVLSLTGSYASGTSATASLNVTYSLDTDGNGVPDTGIFSASASLTFTSGGASLSLSGDWSSGDWTLSSGGKVGSLSTHSFNTLDVPPSGAVLFISFDYSTVVNAGNTALAADVTF